MTRTPSGRAIRASDLIGSTLRDFQDENVGNLRDIIVDLESGYIVAAIVGTGGVLGVGETLRALPPSQLQYNAQDDNFTLNMSRQQLEGAMEFTDEQRQNLDNPQWVENLFARYQETVPWEQQDSRQQVRDPLDTDRYDREQQQRWQQQQRQQQQQQPRQQQQQPRQQQQGTWQPGTR
jgi:sporulation protein YlmC with PRC-barrel domain